MKGPVDHVKEFGFYPYGYGRLMEGFSRAET